MGQGKKSPREESHRNYVGSIQLFIKKAYKRNPQVGREVEEEGGGSLSSVLPQTLGLGIWSGSNHPSYFSFSSFSNSPSSYLGEIASARQGNLSEVARGHTGILIEGQAKEAIVETSRGGQPVAITL